MRTNSQKKRTQIVRKLKNKIKRRLKKKQYQKEKGPGAIRLAGNEQDRLTLR